MAVVTKTIIAGGGGDYTTVASWEAAAPSLGTDIWKGVISDNSNYDENVALSAGGTASATSYLWLTVASANRHSGVAGTGHGRMYATVGSHVLTISTPFTRIDWLDIKQDQAGSSDEGIRVLGGGDDMLISYCIIWTDSDAADQDGIYITEQNLARLRIDNCIIYGWRRLGIRISQWTETSRTITVDVDHTSIYDCGVASQNHSGAIGIWSNGASDVITLTLYNIWGAATQGGYEAFFDARTVDGRSVPDGDVTWNGSNNSKDYIGTADIDGTNNITAWQEATDGVVAVTKSSGAWIVVNNLTAGSEDLTLLDDAAGNLMAGNGINRQGSEPDARQDFSIDITGSSRPTTGVDIGAHQVTTVGQTITLGLATETDTALTITPVKAGQIVTLGLATETDTVPTITPIKPIIQSIGLAVETDTVPSITPDKPIIQQIGLAEETDTVPAITPVKPIIQAIGIASETDTALTISPDKPIIYLLGLATETDTALTLTVVRSVVLGIASETDTVPSIVPVKPIIQTIGLASEIDTVPALTVVRSVLLGIPTETDTVLTVTPIKPIIQTIGLVLETDFALTITPIKPIIQSIGLASETDTTFNITAVLGTVVLIVDVNDPRRTFSDDVVGRIYIDSERSFRESGGRDYR